MASKGIIEEFAEAQARATLEPERRGVPKGDPIDFGPEKVKAAAMLALSSKTLRELSQPQALGVSEDLLSKWYREEAFQVLMRKLAREFGPWFTERMRRKATELEAHKQSPEKPNAEAPGPAAEYSIVEAAKDRVETESDLWNVSARLEIGSFLEAQEEQGPLSKWILRRVPHSDYVPQTDDDRTIHTLAVYEHKGQPLKFLLQRIDARLRREAEKLLQRPELDRHGMWKLRLIWNALNEGESPPSEGEAKAN
jgi:hypothetical protein